MSNEYVMLKNPLHKNYLKFEVNEELSKNIFVTPDGSIIAFRENYIDGLNKKDLTLSMLGYKDSDLIPNQINNEEDLKKILYCLKQ